MASELKFRTESDNDNKVEFKELQNYYLAENLLDSQYYLILKILLPLTVKKKTKTKENAHNRIVVIIKQYIYIYRYIVIF